MNLGFFRSGNRNLDGIRSKWRRTLAGSRGRPVAALALTLATLFSMTGCQTPDLKPFSVASTEVAASINRGGDLVVTALKGEIFIVNGEVVPLDSPNHPAVLLAAEWTARKKATDALLAYSASLAAIGEASANRKANATALYNSVQKLAEAIPGVNLGTSAVGNVLINTAGAVVEIKAWKNMGDAVRGADPAIQAMAKLFSQDLASLELAHKSRYDNAIITGGTTDIRKLRRLQLQLHDAQSAKRDAVAANPADVAAAAELARIDGLLGPVERDLATYHDQVNRLQAGIDQGKDFFATAAAAVKAWAAAHADLAEALSQKRTPNIALLLARVQELRDSINALKTSTQASPNP